MWNLASCSRASNVTTCTTSAANGLQAGHMFYIRGTSDSTFVVSTNLNVDSSTQFHFSQNAPNGSSTGGVVFTCRHAAICVNVGGQQSASPLIYGDMHTSNGPILMAVGNVVHTGDSSHFVGIVADRRRRLGGRRYGREHGSLCRPRHAGFASRR